VEASTQVRKGYGRRGWEARPSLPVPPHGIYVTLLTSECVRAASHRSNKMCVAHGGGRRCEAEGCDGVPLQGRRICAKCYQKQIDEMLKKQNEKRLVRQAAEAAAEAAAAAAAAEAAAAHFAAVARVEREGGRFNAAEKRKGAE
jgi:hypothetical protein